VVNERGAISYGTYIGFQIQSENHCSSSFLKLSALPCQKGSMIDTVDVTPALCVLTKSLLHSWTAKGGYAQ